MGRFAERNGEVCLRTSIIGGYQSSSMSFQEMELDDEIDTLHWDNPGVIVWTIVLGCIGHQVLGRSSNPSTYSTHMQLKPKSSHKIHVQSHLGL